MDNVNNLLKKYNISPVGYTKKKNVLIVETKDNKYVIKKKKKDVSEIYNYLKTRNFEFFPYNYVNDDEYEITEFIEDNNLSNYDKGVEIINLISLLHNKT